jgi:4-carboxymuconolactone decarboxylase
MSRLPYLRYEELGQDGQQVWDHVVGSRGALMVNEHGGLPGPFNAFVHAPGVGAHLSLLGAAVRFRTSIERRLTELAIITVGARWKAEFEWWAHAAMAREHGIAESVIDAIKRGDEPPLAAEDERVVYAVAAQLTKTGQVDEGRYAAARELLGEAGLVELVTLCGYYTLISFLLNCFEVPLPAGAAAVWGGEGADEAGRVRRDHAG